jgi:hypothetical protein
VLSEVHKLILARSTPDPSAQPPLWDITGEVKPVDRLDLPPPDFSGLESTHREFARLIPSRLEFTPDYLIDLSEYYNAAFRETWHPGVNNNTLEMLPAGLLQLAGTSFDVRGIIQLSGKRLSTASRRYPRQVNGIKIGQLCRHLHFLHGAGWGTRDGTRVGAYVVHYTTGAEHSIPIVYGEDVRDWNGTADASTKLSRASIVWRAKNYADFSVRLFKTSWVNPAPESEIATIDFISANEDPAPFLLAITADP